DRSMAELEMGGVHERRGQGRVDIDPAPDVALGPSVIIERTITVDQAARDAGGKARRPREGRIKHGEVPADASLIFEHVEAAADHPDAGPYAHVLVNPTPQLLRRPESVLLPLYDSGGEGFHLRVIRLKIWTGLDPFGLPTGGFDERQTTLRVQRRRRDQQI